MSERLRQLSASGRKYGDERVVVVRESACGQVARPHPGPLPQGEGDLFGSRGAVITSLYLCPSHVVRSKRKPQRELDRARGVLFARIEIVPVLQSNGANDCP